MVCLSVRLGFVDFGDFRGRPLGRLGTDLVTFLGLPLFLLDFLFRVLLRGILALVRTDFAAANLMLVDLEGRPLVREANHTLLALRTLILGLNFLGVLFLDFFDFRVTINA